MVSSKRFGEVTIVDPLDVVRWLIAVSLGLFGACGTVCNYACIASWLFRGEHRSMVPFVGGVCMALAWLMCPAVSSRGWAWIPLVLDPGCLLLLLVSVPFFIVMFLRGYNAGQVDPEDRQRE